MGRPYIITKMIDHIHHDIFLNINVINSTWHDRSTTMIRWQWGKNERESVSMWMIRKKYNTRLFRSVCILRFVPLFRFVTAGVDSPRSAAPIRFVLFHCHQYSCSAARICFVSLRFGSSSILSVSVRILVLFCSFRCDRCRYGVDTVRCRYGTVQRLLYIDRDIP